MDKLNADKAESMAPLPPKQPNAKPPAAAPANNKKPEIKGQSRPPASKPVWRPSAAAVDKAAQKSDQPL